MGFSANWLTLREPADREARDARLAHAAARAAGQTPLVVDLGCGTGSTWRALSPLLPPETRWRFIDNDPDLLAAAGAAAGASAELMMADLGDIANLPLSGATLITASALLDLMPDVWVRGLAQQVQVPFYAALSYDGIMTWEPSDPRDAPVTDAFNRHQRRDKGLGPALGPDAGLRSAQIFEAAGFDVMRAASPWVLGPDKAPLHAELVDGIAIAAAETGAAGAASWGVERQAKAVSDLCRIGHLDILAMPRPTAERTVNADR